MISPISIAVTGVYQDITDGGHIINRHPVGKQLQCACWHDRSMQFLKEYGCGWLDGGCLTLALAISEVLGKTSTLYGAVLVDSGAISHVLVKAGAYYLDGDGLGDGVDVINKLRHIDMQSKAMSIERISFHDAISSGIPFWKEAARGTAAEFINSQVFKGLTA